MITVIGLGNGKDGWSEKGRDAALSAAVRVLKTKFSPGAEALSAAGAEFLTLDKVYESSRNFDTLTRNLASAVIKLHKERGSLCYLVDGSGLDDASVAEIERRAGKLVRVIPAAAKAAEAGISACSYAVYSAYDAAAAVDLAFSRAYPLVITEIDTAFLAGDVKLKLSKYFGGEERGIYICQGDAREIPLFELDRQKKYDHTSVFALHGAPLAERERYGFYDLSEIMARLRGEDGCPWDREQTHESIRINAVEEAYELVEAIDLSDPEKMAEETGDVLLQAVFHAAIGEDAGEYDLSDVLTVLCKKLIFRHSHIFGSERAATAEDALKAWDRNKAEEKSQVSFTDMITSVPKQFPALLRAEKIQRKAAKAGYDFEDAEAALEKLKEEISELALAASPEEREDEGGDVLFAAVNWLRHLGLHPEIALAAASDKFSSRFAAAEELAHGRGKRLNELGAAELDELWRAAKEGEKP